MCTLFMIGSTNADYVLLQDDGVLFDFFVVVFVLDVFHRKMRPSVLQSLPDVPDTHRLE